MSFTGRAPRDLFAEPQMAQDEVRVIKTVLCGQDGVGKTSILTRLRDGQFDCNVEHTIGVQFVIHTMDAADGSAVKLQCWDTAGQERFRSIIGKHFQDAHVLMFVYDVNERSSFRTLPEWVKQAGWRRNDEGNFQTHYSKRSIAYVVGNKVDLDERFREVSKEEAEEFARKFEMGYTEVSALSGDGVIDLFRLVATDSCVYDKVIAHEAKLSGRVEEDGENDDAAKLLQGNANKCRCCIIV